MRSAISTATKWPPGTKWASQLGMTHAISQAIEGGTIVSSSPCHGATPAALVAAEAEIVVSLMGYDENLAQTVHARHRYQPGDVAWGARFVDILIREPGGMRRIDYARFHDVVPLAAAGSE